MKGRTEYAPKKVAEFLAEIRETGGNITKAAERIGVGRQTVYDWKAAHADFSAQWDEALTSSIEDLEQEAKRRAFSGTDEPVFYKGQKCGLIRKYSDTLLIFLLKAHKPAMYREQLKIIPTSEVDETIKQAVQTHNLPQPETFGGEPVLDSEM